MDQDKLDKIGLLIEKFAKNNLFIAESSLEIRDDLIPDISTNSHAIDDLLAQMPTENDIRDYIFKLKLRLNRIKYNAELCENNLIQLDKEFD